MLSAPPPEANERISYGAEPLQFGDLRLPPAPGPHPVVVVIHGGYWRAGYGLEHMGHACGAITKAGFATWNIEYRRIGDPGGAWPGTFLDVAAAVDYVHTLAPRYNLDTERVATLGHSAGGHLAVWSAARQRIPEGDPLYTTSPLRLKGAISLAGVLDLRRAWELRLSNDAVLGLMGSPPDAAPERYVTASPVEMLPLHVLQILLHGTRDEDVPYEISERYYQAALSKGDPVKLVSLPGAGHFGLIDPRSRQWPAVLRAVRESLG